MCGCFELVDLGRCLETLEISKRKKSKKKKGKRGGGEKFEEKKSLAVDMKAREIVGSEGGSWRRWVRSKKPMDKNCETFFLWDVAFGIFVIFGFVVE